MTPVSGHLDKEVTNFRPMSPATGISPGEQGQNCSAMINCVMAERCKRIGGVRGWYGSDSVRIHHPLCPAGKYQFIARELGMRGGEASPSEQWKAELTAEGPF